LPAPSDLKRGDKKYSIKKVIFFNKFVQKLKFYLYLIFSKFNPKFNFISNKIDDLNKLG
jgi:hypothetical protein